MPVALGLDVGERRIGVARSDGWGLLATPVTAVIRTSDRAAVDAVGRLAGEAGATLLVVGLPLGTQGEMTAQAERIAAFGHKLERRLGVRVVFWNERFSTAEAGERLRAGHPGGASGAADGHGAGDAESGWGGRRAGRGPTPSAQGRERARRREDAAAAAVILQEFLDQQRQLRPEPTEGS